MKGKESQNVRRQDGVPHTTCVRQALLVATSARVKQNDLQRHVKLKGDFFAYLALNLK